MIHALIAIHHEPLRTIVSGALRRDTEIRVVGEAADIDALLAADDAEADVVCVDLPVLIRLARHTRSTNPERGFPHVVAVLPPGRRRTAARFVATLPPDTVSLIEEPRSGEDASRWRQRLRNVIRIASGRSVIEHVGDTASPVAALAAGGRGRVLAIGASTGGPQAVAQILNSLPPLPIPVLLVVHFPQGLFDHFLDWLSSVSTMPVAPAVDGAPLESLSGVVTVAVPGRHMVVTPGCIRLNDEPRRHFCRPSVDVLFESLARGVGRRTIAVLLTGMGIDGAAGLLQIRRAGGRTLAQDEATSVVWGMPKAAIERDAAETVLPIHEMAPAILGLCRRQPAAVK